MDRRIYRIIEEREVYIVFSFLFIVLNISAITMIYGFSDDYSHLYNYSTNNYSELENMLLGYGRPINAILYNFFFSNIQSISNLTFLRIFSLFGILVVIYYIFEILKNQSLSKMEIFILLMFLSTIPAINLVISWASLFTIPIALILSIGSAISVRKTLHNKILFEKNTCWTLLSIFLLLCSSFIHQTASMYYWVIVGIFLFLSTDYKENSSILLKHFLKFLVIWLTSMTLSYSWIYFYSAKINGGEFERINLSSNYLNKILWFIYEVVVRSLNFHLLSDSKILPIIFLIIIIFGLFLFFNERRINKLIGFVIVILLMLLSYFPNLVVNENWASYRTQIALSSLFVVLIFSGLKSVFLFLKIKNGWWVYKFILVCAGFSSLFLYSYHQTKNITFPQSLEIGYIRYRLSEFRENLSDEIFVIQPSIYDSLSNRLFGYDEFGIPSSIQSWTPEPMIRLIMREMNIDDENLIIKILPPGTTNYSNQTPFVIDMRMLRQFKSPP